MSIVTGGQQFEEALKRLGKRLGTAREVRIGFMEDATYPDGTHVASVAAINNFGAPAAGIPARPFFTDMIVAKSAGWAPRFAESLKATDYSAKMALGRLGLVIDSQLRRSIVEYSAVPNSPVTDLLKQRFPTGDGITFSDVQRARGDVKAGKKAPAGKPLIWSGNMEKSVSFEVI